MCPGESDGSSLFCVISLLTQWFCHRVKLCIFSLVVVLCFLMIPIVTKGDTDDFYFYGGLVGIISTVCLHEVV